MFKVFVEVTYVNKEGYYDGDKDLFIHFFATEPEARAYIMGVREAASPQRVTAKLNGKDV